VHSAASSGSYVNATREGFFVAAYDSQWWFYSSSDEGFRWRCRWCSRARVAGDVPSAAWLVVVGRGARQIWFARQSNSGEVDGVVTEAVCVFARSSVDLWHWSMALDAQQQPSFASLWHAMVWRRTGSRSGCVLGELRRGEKTRSRLGFAQRRWTVQGSRIWSPK